MLLKRLLTSVLFVFLLTSVIGCEQRANDPLKVGTFLWAGYEPLHLAEEQGFFQNSEIDLIELASATAVIRAIKNGSVEAATLTLDETIGLLVADVDLSIVAVMDVSHGADMVISREALGSLKEVSGKRIGVEMGGVGVTMLAGFLDHAGLTATDVEIVPLTLREHVSAFESANVDIVVTFEPMAGQLLNGGGHKVFDSSNIPRRILDVLIVRADSIEKHSDRIQQLLSGYFMARQMMASNEEKSFSAMAVRTSISYDDIRRSYEGLHLPSLEENRIWLRMCDRYIGGSVRQLSELMVKQDLIEFVPANHLVCDAAWVEGVEL